MNPPPLGGLTTGGAERTFYNTAIETVLEEGQITEAAATAQVTAVAGSDRGDAGGNNAPVDEKSADANASGGGGSGGSGGSDDAPPPPAPTPAEVASNMESLSAEMTNLIVSWLYMRSFKNLG